MLDLVVLGAYLSAVLIVAFRAMRGRKAGLEDYLLAGRTLTLPSFVATVVPSFYGGVMGVGEYTYRYGLSNWLIQGVPYYVFALLYAAFLAGRVRGFSGRTLPDHLEGAFGAKTAALAALWLALLANPATELLMLGVLGHWLTGWPLWACVASSAVLGSSFLLFGGLRADVGANRLQFVVMYLGFALILPFAWKAAGGWQGLSSHLPASHLDWTGGNSPGYILAWFFIALWTFVDPSFHQRVCAAKDARVARLGLCASVLFWCLFDFMTTFAGLCARVILPDLKDPLMAYPELAQRLLSPLARGIFLAGMCSSVIAALCASSLVSATSLAKDAAGRALGVSEADSEGWIRWGLALTGMGGTLLALALPSVVSLWYAVGSAAVPGLLVVTLSCYFERLRVSPSAALAASALGGGVSLAWLCAGWGRSSPLLGVEPFYPGLAASLLAWGVGRWGQSFTSRGYSG